MRTRTIWGRGACALVGLGAAVLVASCKGEVESSPPSLGQSCVPADEFTTSFSGFDEDEVSIGIGNPACGAGAVCLVNHFRGRVSCPYGQTQSSIESLDAGDPERCVVPNNPEATVEVPVRPQLADREPEDAVYCSCRCGSASDHEGAGYCSCPRGFACEPLVEDLGLGSELAGSYCIRRDTAWDETAPPGRSCNLIEQNCGSPRPELDVPPPGPEETTTNQFVEHIAQGSIDKIDLLLMVDNSISMADKQELFSQAIPALLLRLIDPLCEDGDGNLVAKVGGSCPAGTREQFSPIADLHLGVVSSSLGGHGGVLCSPALGDSFDVHQDDRGELVAPLRGVASYLDLGFLKWDPRALSAPPGTEDPDAFVADVRDLVLEAGERGCGYEAGLESWYRFLIDPQPPVEIISDGNYSLPGDVNTTLLEQRSWFLRPDSVVAIVMLSDENDCSIRDDGVSWLIGDQTKRIPRGTEACLVSPNNPCCRSCALAEASPPSGCAALSADPHCVQGPYQPTEESLNLRCFAQQRRFGIDFLYPIVRYVDGLKLPTVLGRDCATDSDCPSNHSSQLAGECLDLGGKRLCEYVNPLNAPNRNYPTLVPRADSSLVYLAGIVGVPWQDIATEQSLSDPNALEFLRVTEDPHDPGAPTLMDRWDVIVGDPDNWVPPTDPFMVESIDPRDGLGANPITGDAPAPVSSPAGTSPFNGHEYTIPQRDDLQYACIFPLGTTRDCATAAGGCDCKAIDTGSQDRPLCQAPGTTANGTTQYYAKAYPGLRFLQLLKEYGNNSIVASVCPKITDPARSAESSYGYNPVADGLVERVTEKFGGACLPRVLPVDDDGLVSCQIVEATNPTFDVSCDTLGRRPLGGALANVVRNQLEASGRCGLAGGQVACEQMVLCGIEPATDYSLCQNAPDEQLGEGPVAGYCYIDAMQDLDGDGRVECISAGDPDCIGNPELVANCDPSQRRILRFVSRGVSPEVPFGTATIFVGCESQSAL